MFTPSERKDSTCRQSSSERMLRFPSLVCSPEAKRALPGTFILWLMTTFRQSNLTGAPPNTFIINQSTNTQWSDTFLNKYGGFVRCVVRREQTICIFLIFFNRREKQHIRAAWRWRVWSSAVFIDRAKHCLFSSNPTVDHEVFIPRLPVMKAVLCIM